MRCGLRLQAGKAGLDADQMECNATATTLYSRAPMSALGKVYYLHWSMWSSIVTSVVHGSACRLKTALVRIPGIQVSRHVAHKRAECAGPRGALRPKRRALLLDSISFLLVGVCFGVLPAAKY